jgi:hypothetical protein
MLRALQDTAGMQPTRDPAPPLDTLRDSSGTSFTNRKFAPFDGWAQLGLRGGTPDTGLWLPSGQQAALVQDCVFTHCVFDRLLTGVRFERCSFVRCHFHLDMRSVDLNMCTFKGCNLSWAAFESCKMKFLRCTDNTFNYSVLLGCDLYRSSFFAPSNTFSESVIALVSLTRASLEGVAGISRRTFRPAPADSPLPPGDDVPDLDPSDAIARREEALTRAHGRRPLIQEDRNEYRQLLVSTRGTTTKRESSLDRRYAEAAEVWRMMSSVLTTRGGYGDAGWAYVWAKRRERQDANPLRKRYLTRTDTYVWQLERRPKQIAHSLGKYVLLLLADALCGFGNAFGRILVWIGGVTVLFACLLAFGGGLDVQEHVHQHTHPPGATFFQSWEFATGQLATSPPKGFMLTATGWEVGAAIETLFGVALVGLFGFVVANRIRFA